MRERSVVRAMREVVTGRRAAGGKPAGRERFSTALAPPILPVSSSLWAVVRRRLWRRRVADGRTSFRARRSVARSDHWRFDPHFVESGLPVADRAVDLVRSFSSIASILQHGLDQRLRASKAPEGAAIQHANIRGQGLPLTKRETMLTHPHPRRLIALGLAGMAKALEEQRRQTTFTALDFEASLA